MKEKKILPLVLSMSMPMVLSMLVNALYNIVDSYFVAKISDEAMTALSLVYPLQLLETAVAVGFGVGINAIAAFYLGAKNDRKANDSVSVGLVLSFVHGILLMAFNLLFAPTFLRMFSKDNLVIEYGLTYSYVVFAFTVPYTIAITYEKIFQAEGQMKVSMFSMICGCVANVILDPLMIFGIGPFPRMGIAGAALATGIGQIIPLVVYLLLYFKLKLPLKVQFRKEMFDKELCLHIYGVGVPATLNMALPSFMITALNGILSTYGDVYVLVLGIYYKLQTFIYLTANGMVQGIRPIIGYNYGAGEYGRVKKNILHLSAADSRYYAGRHDYLSGILRTAYGHFYHRCGNNCRRKNRHPNYQYGFCGFLGVRDRKRYAGRTGKGQYVPCHFPAAVSRCHYSGSLRVRKAARCGRYLELLLVCGNSRRYCGLDFIQKRRTKDEINI